MFFLFLQDTIEESSRFIECFTTLELAKEKVNTLKNVLNTNTKYVSLYKINLDQYKVHDFYSSDFEGNNNNILFKVDSETNVPLFRPLVGLQNQSTYVSTPPIPQAITLSQDTIYQYTKLN